MPDGSYLFQPEPDVVGGGRSRRRDVSIRPILPLHLRLRCWMHRRGVETAMALTLIGMIIIGLSASPWDNLTTLRHWGAAPNCTSARLVGLVPASRGQPGYYPAHDADQDGVACGSAPADRLAGR